MFWSVLIWTLCVNFFIILNVLFLFMYHVFLISNFRLVLNVVGFLLGNFLVSEVYMPMFRNNLSHLHRRIGTYPPMKVEQTECFEPSAYKLQTPGNYPEESIQHVPCIL